MKGLVRTNVKLVSISILKDLLHPRLAMRFVQEVLQMQVNWHLTLRPRNQADFEASAVSLEKLLDAANTNMVKIRRFIGKDNALRKKCTSVPFRPGTTVAEKLALFALLSHSTHGADHILNFTSGRLETTGVELFSRWKTNSAII